MHAQKLTIDAEDDDNILFQTSRQGSRRGSRLKDGRGRIVKSNNMTAKNDFPTGDGNYRMAKLC